MANGDVDALADLYDAHAGAVYSLARRILSNEADAEDVTHDVFMQAWRDAGRYDPARGEVAAWLLVIARTRAIDFLRRCTRAHSAGSAYQYEIPNVEQSVEYVVATSEQVARVQDALGQLPDDQRRPLELSYYAGLTHAEIAAETGWPLGTVKTRIRSAVATLRRALGESSGARRVADD